MAVFAASAFMGALGWALLHSLWEFALLWLLFRSLLAALPTLPARGRHNLAAFLLLAGTLAFLLTFSWKYHFGGAALPLTLGMGFQNDWLTHLTSAIQAFLERWMPLLSLFYMLSLGFLFIKLTLYIRHAHHLSRQGITKMPFDWRLYVRDMAGFIGIRRPVSIYLSAWIDTPQVIGILRPVILFPLAFLNQLDTAQVEALLLHELVHIKRNDYLVNLFIAASEILFFFNPFVKQLARALRREREYSCDDMVLQFQYSPAIYAAALLLLERGRSDRPLAGIAAFGSEQKQLLNRVKRILGQTRDRVSLPYGLMLLLVLFAGLLSALLPLPPGNSKAPATPPLYASGTLPPSQKENKQLLFENRIKSGSYPLQKSGKQAPVVNAENNPEASLQELQDLNTEEMFPLVNNYPSAETDYAPRDAMIGTRIEFSTPDGQGSAAMVPDAPTENGLAPYIPSNSFYYQLAPDSTPARSLPATARRVAAETYLKTKKALASLDWKKIEQSMNLKKEDLQKLKTAVAKELSALNWDQINRQAQDEIISAQDAAGQSLAAKATELKQYKEAQQYYDLLQHRLLDQQQLLKTRERQWQLILQKQQAEQKKLELEMKNRKIIYI